MNRMKEIATMLDLLWIEDEKRSEIFSVIDDENKLMGDDFYISIAGLNRVREFQIYAHTFSRLLAGDNTIRKRLRKGDAYYLIDPHKDKGYQEYKWDDDYYDNYWLRTGRLYRTEKEVQEDVQKLGWGC